MITNETAVEGERIWEPSPQLIQESNLYKFQSFLRSKAVLLDSDYESLWQWSVDDVERFWEEFVDFAGLQLGGEQRATLEGDSMFESRWFPGRTLNFAEILCAEGTGTAIICVNEANSVREVSREELRSDVAAFAEHLRQIGVSAEDRVVGLLPNVYEAVVGLLATSSLGAVWSVCAPEFGAGAVTSRFRQLEPTVLLAVPGYKLNGKDRDKSQEVIEIIEELPSLREVIWVTEHTEISTPKVNVPTISWDETIATNAELEFVQVDFNHPLWVLFSSGTTGTPKGIVHSHGGAALELTKMLLIHGDLRPDDRYFNVASTSWVVWNSLVSALAVGAVPILYDGSPSYPDIQRVWSIASEHDVAVLGLSAGYVHACIKQGAQPRANHDLSKLRTIQVTGSPLSAEAYRWVYQKIGDVWLSSMSGGTDIASIFVGGTPTLPVNVGYIQAPALGAKVECWDDQGNPTTGKGELVVTSPMPSMPLKFWGDDGTRYWESYFSTFPGVWRHGDFIEFSDLGITIHGRSDATLNRQGLRIGSADIYEAVEIIPEVVESLVIGAEMGTEYFMPLFVHLEDGADHEVVEQKINDSIRSHLSARYLPDKIVFVRGIPHTRTGKKLEVPIKKMLQGARLTEVVNTDSVDDAGLLQEFAEFAQLCRTEHADSP